MGEARRGTRAVPVMPASETQRNPARRGIPSLHPRRVGYQPSPLSAPAGNPVPGIPACRVVADSSPGKTAHAVADGCGCGTRTAVAAPSRTAVAVQGESLFIFWEEMSRRPLRSAVATALAVATAAAFAACSGPASTGAATYYLALGQSLSKGVPPNA